MYAVLLQALARGLESAVLPFLEWLATKAWHTVERLYSRHEAVQAKREQKKGAPPTTPDGATSETP